MLMPALRDLEIRHLVALDAVATEGTFGRAAERLGYTQSAISQQIAALERLIDGKLFDRPGGPRPVELTPLGRRGARRRPRPADAGRRRQPPHRPLPVGRDRPDHGRHVPEHVGGGAAARDRAPARASSPAPRCGCSRPITTSSCSRARQRRPRRVVRGRRHRAGLRVASPDGGSAGAAGADAAASSGGPVSCAALADEPTIGQHSNSCQLTCEMGLREAGVVAQLRVPHQRQRHGGGDGAGRDGRRLHAAAVRRPVRARASRCHATDPPLPPRTISIAWRSGRTISPRRRALRRHHRRRVRRAGRDSAGPSRHSPDLGGCQAAGIARRVGIHSDAGWSSPVARRAHNPKVAGSNPAPATK